MPEPVRPNPSFVLLDIPDAALLPEVARGLAPFVNGEGGSPLTHVGGTGYALARHVGKRLRLIGSDAEISRRLLAIRGVRGWRALSADEMIAAMSEGGLAHRASPPTPISLPTSWNIDMVRAPDAWAMFPGGLAAAPWRRVRVGHIDTGYTEHPAFGPWVDGRSPSVLAEEGLNFFDGGGSPRDLLKPEGTPGHGTRTMSVLAGYEPGVFSGVAPQLTVVPYRVTNFVVIDTLWNRNRLDLAIEDAWRNKGCRVLSISLGDPCFPPRTVGRAVDLAYEAGVIIVAAAGNVTSEVTFPGRYSRAIGVGGVTHERKYWSGASRGATVDISAPAESVHRATVTVTPQGLVYGYSGLDGDGTSYATVHVSGAAALWLAYHGDTLAPYAGWRTVEAFRTLVCATATKPTDGWEAIYGSGILDIAALLAAPLPAPETLTKVSSPAEIEVA